MKGLLRTLPLLTKMAAIAALVGALVWVAMDPLYFYLSKKLFLGHILDNLAQHAQRDRLQLDQVVKGFHQSLQVVTHQKGFMDYVERMADSEWLKEQPVHINIHRHPPSWFPSNSVVRNFLPARHAILLDGESRVREVYQHLRQTPSSLLPPSPLLLQLSRGDTFMTYLDEGLPYVLTSDVIRRRSGRVLATLIFAAPMDDQFLASLQAKRPVGRGIMVLFDGQENPVVLSSSDHSAVAPGASLEELRQRFFVSTLDMFDQGSSDLLVQFASLISKKEAMETVVAMAGSERYLRLLSNGVLFVAMLLVLLGLARRVVRLQQRLNETMAPDADEAAGVAEKGDQIHLLEKQLEQLLAQAREHRLALESKNQQLEGQGAYLQVVMANMEDGILVIDQRGMVESMNPAAEKIFGRSSQEMAGHSLRHIMGETLWERHYKAVANFNPNISSKVVGSHIEVTALRADGSSFPLDLRVREISLNGERRFIGLLRDLTESKRLALVAGLRESDRLFRDVLEKVQLAVVILDPESRITFCNDFFLHMTGWSRQEVLGLVWWEYFLPREQQAMASKFFGHVATEASQSFHHHAFEAEVVVREGTTHLFLWHALLLRDDDHQLHHQVMIGHDITWRRKIEQETFRAQEEAQRASQAKTRYLSRLNHEIRSPLNAITGFVSILLGEQDKLPDDMADYLRHMEQSSRNLVELLNNILDYARIEEGRLTAVPEEVNPRLLVQGAFHLHKQEAQQKGLAYTYHLAEPLPQTILGDRTLLNRILMGLLVHAIHAAPQGGRVKLSASREEEWFCLSVEDDGAPVSPELGDLVFESFQEDKSGRFAVCDMALPLVKKAVDKLGGRVSCKNLKHHGVAIAVRIPMVSLPESELPMLRFHGKPRVLAILEEGAGRLAMGGMLQQMGVEPILAASLEEAAARPGAAQASLLVVDNPQLQTARDFQGAYADLGEIPRILLQDGPFLPRPYDETVVGVLIKPVSREKLCELMARVLSMVQLEEGGTTVRLPPLATVQVAEIRALLEELAALPLYRAEKIVALGRETKKRCQAFQTGLPTVCDAIVEAIYSRNSSRVPDLVTEARIMLENEYGHDSGGG